MWPIPLPANLISRALIYAAFAFFFFMVGMGVHKTFSDRKIARMEREYAEARADAAFALAEAERKHRDTEARWVQTVNQKEKEYVEALKQRDHIVRDLAVAGDGLRYQINQLTRDSQASATAHPTCRHLADRVATLGLLLQEADGLAEESSRAADDLREDLALCRGYVATVTAER